VDLPVLSPVAPILAKSAKTIPIDIGAFEKTELEPR